MIKKITILLIFFCVIFATTFALIGIGAEHKTWSGTGDKTTWSDDSNWYPAMTPIDGDAVIIDSKDISIMCTETFAAGSITLGGRPNSTLISNDFVFGTISPPSGSDVAVLNRSGGTWTLKGPGVITLKGQYKDSHETLTSQPSFMFWIE